MMLYQGTTAALGGNAHVFRISWFCLASGIGFHNFQIEETDDLPGSEAVYKPLLQTPHSTPHPLAAFICRRLVLTQHSSNCNIPSTRLPFQTMQFPTILLAALCAFAASVAAAPAPVKPPAMVCVGDHY